MGKKGKPAKTQEDVAPSEEGAEGTNITGVFENDFPLLCAQSGLPAIPVRVLSRENQTVGDSKVEYSVLVDGLQEEPAAIKTLHLRGWLVDERIVSLLRKALQSTMLTTLDLWNTGLNEATLEQLVLLINDLNLKSLSIDGNDHVTAKTLTELIRTNLQSLSLKCCGISHEHLSSAVTPLQENKTLVTLDLSCNRVGDDGACDLACALRLNRSLLSLVLVNNHIGNKGALALAVVLTQFPLLHEEIVARRWLLSQRRTEDELSVPDVEKTTRSPSVVSSMDKTGKMSRLDKDKLSAGKNKKNDSRKEDKQPKKEEKPKKPLEAKKPKGKDSKMGKRGTEQPSDSPPLEMAELPHPLLDGVIDINGWPHLTGNTTLVNLALSHNMIAESGLKALVEAVRSQTCTPHTPGILRLTVQHNATPLSSELGRELDSVLTMRDPLSVPTEQQDVMDKPAEKQNKI
ncbi:hypothetical protein EMCRGX_G030639 [Ephydatia muelleri]|eukprot:Em0010g884a